MIGVFHTTHPTEGFGISVRYVKVDSKIRILGIHTYGKDILDQLSSDEINLLKSQIPV